MDTRIKNNDVLESDEIDLQVFIGDMWRGFIKFWWVCVCLALLIGGIQFYRSYIRYIPRYTCTATYTVLTENVYSVGESGLSTYTFTYNKSTADQLSKVYSYAVNSVVVRQRVCADLGVPAMPAVVTAACVADSNLLTITALGSDPEMTYNVIGAVVENCSAVTDHVIGRTKLVTISPPEIPTSPSNSRDWISAVLMGVLIGFFVGIVWIAFYAFIRNTVRTKEDIRTKLNKHCLGALPQVTFKKYRQEINTDILLSNPRIGNDFFESMRLLRSSVRTSLGENGKVMMITSTAPGEGKSVTTINLAAMFAKNEERVLIIDCDLRNSGIHAALTLDNEICRDDTTHSIIYHVESLAIDVLRFDARNIHPRHILRESFLQNVIDGIRGQYDYILVDTPPCGVISDAASVARVVDGVIYVIRQDTIMLSSIRSSINSILSTDVKVLGCVLNGATGGYGGYGSYYSYRGYYRYYRYGYSHNYGEKKSRRRRERKTES